MEYTVPYDIENWKKFPDVLKEGEEVVFTEKLHGSFCGVGVVPQDGESEKHWRNKIVVFSKGLGGKGLCLLNSPNNANNAYIRALTECGVFDKLEQATGDGEPIFFLGEVFGKGIQDLSYNIEKPIFRVFDVVIGYRGDQVYMDYNLMKVAVRGVGLEIVSWSVQR
jgi:RNA ligase (TIGR02306 family)